MDESWSKRHWFIFLIKKAILNILFRITERFVIFFKIFQRLYECKLEVRMQSETLCVLLIFVASLQSEKEDVFLA